MLPDQAAAATGVTDTAPWFENQFDARYCAIYPVLSSEDWFIGAIAFTNEGVDNGGAIGPGDGGRGAIDVLSVGLKPSLTSSSNGIPTTTDGLTIGSTADEITSVYGARAVDGDSGLGDTETIMVTGVDNLAIRFLLDAGRVTSIETGDADAIKIFYECA